MAGASAPYVFFFQAEDGIRDGRVTGAQTCALPISARLPAALTTPSSSPGFLGPVPMLCRYPCAGKLIAAGATRPQEQAMAKTKPFVSDIENIRKRARQDIDKGAMTAGYKADRATVVTLLNHALATEIVCVLRYKST